MYRYFEKDKKEFEYLDKFSNLEKQLENGFFKEAFTIEEIILPNKIICSDLENPKISLEIKNSLKEIIKDSIKIFKENGLNNSIDTHGLIEYHYYENAKIMPLAIHVDDFGGVNYKVNTIIYYLDKTVEGGNLEIYKNHKTLQEIIDVKPSKNKIKILVMEGNILHNVSQIKSNGIRECIVVQLLCFRN